MKLSMTGEAASAYQSGSQRARIVTELWGAQNLYCPNCPSPKLERLPDNTRAHDFTCPKCRYWYQLKGQRASIGNNINDGAYAAMMEAIENDRTPNFYFMQYSLSDWSVKNLLLVPSFAFPKSAIVKRNALSPTAKRAGWVGCVISLSQIPIKARIAVISEGHAVPAAQVRKKYRAVKPLQMLNATERGWLLDVWTALQKLGKTEFSTEDVYSLAEYLSALHPNNNNVEAKIRQQLQFLRDKGLLVHVARGLWRLS